MTSKSKKYPLFHILTIIFASLSLMACDGKNEITMIDSGNGNRPGDKNCDKVFCKAARDSKANEMGSLAIQASGWSEMILVAALNQKTAGIYSKCVEPAMSEDGTLLSFESNNSRHCRMGKDTVVSKLMFDIVRDDNGQVKKISVKNPKAVTSPQDFDYNFKVTRSVDDDYSISTYFTVNITIERLNAFTYRFSESVAVKSERIPAPEKIDTFSVSEFRISDFRYSGKISFKMGENEKLITEIDMDSQKDEDSEPLNGLVFNTIFETEESKRNRKPEDFRSSFTLFEELDESRVSFCGIPSGRYHYKTQLEKTPSGKDEWVSVGASKDYLEMSETHAKAVIGKQNNPITTCKKQFIGRLFNISNQLDQLFDDFHLSIGTKKPIKTQSNDKSNDNKKETQKARNGSTVNTESRPAPSGNGCMVGKQWVPEKLCD